MARSYDDEGFMLEISIESDISVGPSRRAPTRPGYIAIVRCRFGLDWTDDVRSRRLSSGHNLPFTER
jgi:hypothetical protein